MAIQRLLIGHSKKICRRVSERCHLRQLRRLDHMHKEIKRIGKQKTKEFETRKIESKKIVKNGRRLFRPLRSRKHDACHICLVDYEPGDQVIKILKIVCVQWGTYLIKPGFLGTLCLFFFFARFWIKIAKFGQILAGLMSKSKMNIR